MKPVLSGAVAGALLILFSFPLPAQDASDSTRQLDQCREYTDAEKRLACYDAIGEPAAAVAATPAATAAAAAAPASAVPDAPQEAAQSAGKAEAADDFGLPKEDGAYDSISATVVRCQESNYKFYFYLDNGQVWQHIGSKRLRYKSCNSPAKLSQDGLGFRLEIEGEPSLRVKRVR